jgi:RNA-binding protein YhbY
MAESITINTNQLSTLKAIVAAGKATLDHNFDKRTVNALETRGLVKVTTNRKGTFAAPTAKGKKFAN